MSSKSKYVAKGTYGCVLKPAASCASAKVKSKKMNGKVSKLFYNDKAIKEEYDIHMKIVQIVDPKGKFTVRAFGRCNLQYENFVASELEHCTRLKSIKSAKESEADETAETTASTAETTASTAKTTASTASVESNASSASSESNDSDYEEVQMFNPGEKVRQIIYEDGGIDLSSIISKHSMSFDSIFWAMQNVFDGLVTLEKKGFVHLDIKPGNMVYTEKGNGKVAIIDFGLCTTLNKVLSRKMAYIHLHPYAVYPPEFMTMHKKKQLSDKRLINLAYVMQFSRLPTEYGKGNRFWDAAIDAFEGDVTFEPVASKIDVYSLGATLLMIYSNLKRKIFRSKQNCTFVEDLIAGMIHVNPAKRFSPTQARKAYKAIIARFKSVAPCPPKKERSPKTKRCITV